MRVLQQRQVFAASFLGDAFSGGHECIYTPNGIPSTVLPRPSLDRLAGTHKDLRFRDLCKELSVPIPQGRRSRSLSPNPRLRRTAALQINNGLQSFDGDMEGFRTSNLPISHFISCPTSRCR